MEVKTIDAKTAHKWLNTDEALLIDVREPAEHKSKAIEEATLLPLSELDKLSLPETKGKKVIIHCQAGKRSHKACESLQDKYPEIEFYSLDGGISAWVDEGFAVKCAGGKVLPLDQQVQLAIGLITLIGVILTIFVSMGFLVLPLITGCGLIMAGLTSLCPMRNFIAKMPWNQ